MSIGTLPTSLFGGIALLAGIALLTGCDKTPTFSAADASATVQRYCADCHNPDDLSGGLSLKGLDTATVSAHPDIWEKVILKLRVGMMPPSDATPPPPEQRAAMVSWLEKELDAAVTKSPDPGPALVRRLNRTEYANAVRDLLGVQVDVTPMLPPDDSAYGFDNIADALGTSPLLVEQYLSAAGKIASLAIGEKDTGPSAQTFRIRQDESQNVQAIGMPVGTVGGGVTHVVLPLDGEYRLQVGYFKSNLGAMKGLELPHDVEIAVDGERVHLATIGGTEDFNALMRNITEAANAVEARSSTTVPLKAGPHDISVGFLYQGLGLGTDRLQGYTRSSQDILDATGHPHIETLVVTGPYNATGAGDTPSRRRIFVCSPEAPTWPTSSAGESSERECANDIVSALARRAYRGAVTPNDVATLMKFYEQGRAEAGFEAGVQTAIERILSSPKFTFRVEHDPAALAPGTVHPVADGELASRLSFFLWSSIPDDELLDLADRGKLSDPAVLEAQVHRMLGDPKARALVDNFAGQWLYLRNVASFVPNSAAFPNFDDNLRQGFLTETQLFFQSIVQEDRSVLDLMTADYTFLNERVAKHYGVPGVYGNHFRRVTLKDERRWGLLGKGSVLMVSSHTDRTSPVVRGKWVFDNILGAPPPAPPVNVPSLDAIDPEGKMTTRARLEQHRANPVCASCHAAMDPIGFALENFDVVGAWRESEHGLDGGAINASGHMLDGTAINGPIELRNALMKRPELFVSTAVEKLMIYALGRGLTPRDLPIVRQIVRETAKNNYRFSDIVLKVVNSPEFRMRAKPMPAVAKQLQASGR